MSYSVARQLLVAAGEDNELAEFIVFSSSYQEFSLPQCNAGDTKPKVLAPVDSALLSHGHCDSFQCHLERGTRIIDIDNDAV